MFGPSLLATMLFEKFGQHQPLNRQRDRYAYEGVDLSLSNLAEQVGACTSALMPLHRLIEAHVLAAERLHGDDTTVPVLAKVKTAAERLAARQELAAPLVAELEQWLREQRATLSRHTPIAKAINYMLYDWPAFALFLTDSRIYLTNNAAERALREIALGRKSWLFAGSDRGGQRAAFMYSLIVTAKLNNIDPQAWLADIPARIADIPQQRLAELLPWNWKAATSITLTAQAA
jgi:hypothetical protein